LIDNLSHDAAATRLPPVLEQVPRQELLNSANLDLLAEAGAEAAHGKMTDRLKHLGLDEERERSWLTQTDNSVSARWEGFLWRIFPPGPFTSPL
jgi:uncharacterized protein YidB (DUF937 family)